ncbi:hypothetical protein PEL8287_03707 [Roseovarius litorisediminis]|uniref:Uncharacterized protein n=1 Tax=Roseovarius litorisediminis TaxID=1312363 RepID=A0A1Y5TLG9_9RHOB|nr:hypothetical protein PEL8287_03707 [Roseovarius litorisediminis]
MPSVDKALMCQDLGAILVTMGDSATCLNVESAMLQSCCRMMVITREDDLPKSPNML